MIICISFFMMAIYKSKKYAMLVLLATCFQFIGFEQEIRVIRSSETTVNDGECFIDNQSTRFHRFEEIRE